MITCFHCFFIELTGFWFVCRSMIHSDPTQRPSTAQILQHRALNPDCSKSKADLTRELKAEKLRNEMLVKQLKVSFFLSYFLYLQIFSNFINLLLFFFIHSTVFYSFIVLFGLYLDSFQCIARLDWQAETTKRENCQNRHMKYNYLCVNFARILQLFYILSIV